MYITLVGFKNYFDKKPFKIGKIIKLVKDFDNYYDDEAISVLIRYAGKVAYVSNSTRTVVRGTMSAGRIYDKIMDEDYGQIKFIGNERIIAKILNSEEIEELRKDPESDINFI